MKFVRQFPSSSAVSELHVELDGDAVVVALVPRDAHVPRISHDFPLAREAAFRGAIVRWLAAQSSRAQFDLETVESIANQIVDEFDNLLPEE